MVKTIYIAIIILVSCSAKCQTLHLFDIESSSLPNLKAKFWSMDSSGNQYFPNESDIVLRENGSERPIKITAPPLSIPKPFSSVITIDISNSMDITAQSITGLILAKSFAYRWISMMQKSECAITSFNDINYLNQDFTDNKQELSKAIASLEGSGGTSYEDAFIEQMSGALLISQSGKNKRAIILITDGSHSPNLTEDKIIAEAKKQNCAIYCVVVGGSNTSRVLNKITSQTYGKLYDNILTEVSAASVATEIILDLYERKPCEIEWQGYILCDKFKNMVELEWKSIRSSAFYEVLPEKIPRLTTFPSFVWFKKKTPGNIFDTTLLLLAQNEDITIESIESKNSNQKFSIVDVKLPLKVYRNIPQRIKVRFEPTDSTLQYGLFEMKTDYCRSTFSLYGGFPNNGYALSPLRVVRPNGGEIVAAGSDTTIVWDGISERDSVDILVSTDNGLTWSEIAKSVVGLQYKWENIPIKYKSTYCLIRIRQNASGINVEDIMMPENVSTVKWSPDGKKIATVTGSSVRVWDAVTKVELAGQHGFFAEDISWNPEGTKIAAVYSNRSLKIWNASTFQMESQISDLPTIFNTLDWSHDGKNIIIGGRNGSIEMRDAATLSLLRVFKRNKYPIESVSWNSNNNNQFVSGGDDGIKVWSIDRDSMQFSLSDTSISADNVTWSPMGNLIASSTYETIHIWDVTQKTLLYSIPSPTTLSIDWSSNGKYLVSGNLYKNLFKDSLRE